MEGFKDGLPEQGRRTFLVPETVSEVLALLYHEQTGIVVSMSTTTTERTCWAVRSTSTYGLTAVR